MGKFPSKPSFFPIFSPIWGEKKKTLQNGGPKENTFYPFQNQPPNQIRLLFKFPPISPSPFSSSHNHPNQTEP